jgi:hypothetical protein
MHVIYLKYGKTIEITEVEKMPLKVRVSGPRKRDPIFRARRQDNIRRTRKICVRRVSAAIEDYGSPLLVTLTFAGDASDAAFASDSLRNFQVRLRAAFPGAESIFIPELSDKGRIHFHGLLFNVPLHFGDTRKGKRRISYGTEREARTLAKLWGEGFVDALQTDGSERLAGYISKYITKGAGEVMFNAMRMIRLSRGIPQEIVIRGKLAEGLQRRYATSKPIREWNKQFRFIGKVSRKIYTQGKKSCNTLSTAVNLPNPRKDKSSP